MDDLERKITQALAPWRGPNTPAYYSGPNPTAQRSNQPPARRKVGTPAQFMAPVDRGNFNGNPWGSRPRISRASRPNLEAVRSLGRHPVAVGLALTIFAGGLFRVATHMGMTAGPVIVHLVWPA